MLSTCNALRWLILYSLNIFQSASVVNELQVLYFWQFPGQSTFFLSLFIPFSVYFPSFFWNSTFKPFSSLYSFLLFPIYFFFVVSSVIVHNCQGIPCPWSPPFYPTSRHYLHTKSQDWDWGPDSQPRTFLLEICQKTTSHALKFVNICGGKTKQLHRSKSKSVNCHLPVSISELP